LQPPPAAARLASSGKSDHVAGPRAWLNYRTDGHCRRSSRPNCPLFSGLLAARQLLVAGSAGEQVQVRGDLGIAVAFQQRARMVLDARATGTDPGEPWRILLLPQPERICLVVRIDALGIHEIGLYKLDEALHLLDAWLPRGPRADPNPAVDADGVLASSERSALVTVTRYTTQGSAEIAGTSSDLILARHDGRLHSFSRDPHHQAKLVPSPRDGKDAHDRLADLLA
jgi:hypothetical protein